jgi:hypothetical protein
MIDLFSENDFPGQTGIQGAYRTDGLGGKMKDGIGEFYKCFSTRDAVYLNNRLQRNRTTKSSWHFFPNGVLIRHAS